MASSAVDSTSRLALPFRPRNGSSPIGFVEDKLSYDVKGPVPVGKYTIPLGVADVKRQGEDVTLVATSSMVQVALEAADILEQSSISAEVVDPRCLKPLDKETILASVRKTNRAVVIDEGCLSCTPIRMNIALASR
jgi:pyruvate dehydrogenase E1 component beta subunit